MELSIDTASDFAGVALSEEGRLVTEVIWRCHANHSAELLPAIDRMLSASRTERTELNAIFVCRGPGSYSGLRAGLSTAMVLAFALKRDLLGVGRLEIDAAQHAAFPGPVCAVHQAGRGELAWAVYRSRGDEFVELVAPRLACGEEFLDEAPSKALFCGELTAPLVGMLRERFGDETPVVVGNAAVRRPGLLASLAWRRYAAGERGNASFVEPIYLREPQITAPRPRA